MSDVPPWIEIRIDRRAEDDSRAVGDQENDPTVKSLPFVHWLPVTGAFSAASTSSVQSCEKSYSLRTTSKPPRYS